MPGGPQKLLPFRHKSTVQTCHSRQESDNGEGAKCKESEEILRRAPLTGKSGDGAQQKFASKQNNSCPQNLILHTHCLEWSTILFGVSTVNFTEAETSDINKGGIVTTENVYLSEKGERQLKLCLGILFVNQIQQNVHASRVGNFVSSLSPFCVFFIYTVSFGSVMLFREVVLGPVCCSCSLGLTAITLVFFLLEWAMHFTNR